MSDLLERLGSICGEGGLLTGEDVTSRVPGFWNQTPLAAKAIVRPRTTEQVSDVLRICNEAGQSVVTHGGLTGLVHAERTREDDVVLSLERMNQVEEINSANRTMTVQAGATLQAVQEAAEAQDMQFTLDLGARGSCAIGGNVATNAGGNRVIRYGMTRDQVLGLEAVQADGTVISSMNHMIKNNAGYDLKQLFIGSEGTLGVITRLVLRLREAAGSEATALIAAPDLDSVTKLLKHMDAGLGGKLSAFEVMWRDFYRLVTSPPSENNPPLDQDYPYYVLIEAQGSHQDADQALFEEVLAAAMESGLIADAVIANSGQDRDALWAIRDDIEQTYNHGPPIIFDVSLKIPDMEDYVGRVKAGLEQQLGDFHFWVFGHMGDGNLHILVACGDDKPDTRNTVESVVYGELEPIGGSVSAEHGIGLEKKPWLHLCRSEAEINLMRTLKAALDPKGILNPGKIFEI